MKQKILATTILTILSTDPVLSDDISGGARADFGSRELIVPCVKVLNSDNEELNGLFFDVVLRQRGKSLNYEVILGDQEEGEVCITAAEALLEVDLDTSDIEGDKTELDDDSDDDSNDDSNDDSDDDSDDDSWDQPIMLLQVAY